MTGQQKTTPRRPVVTVDPAVCWGYPTVAGMPTDAACGRIWAGQSVDETAAEFGRTRAEVLLACWHEVRHGWPRSGYRAEWQRQWLEQAEWSMWHSSWDDVPDPPASTTPTTPRSE